MPRSGLPSFVLLFCLVTISGRDVKVSVNLIFIALYFVTELCLAVDCLLFQIHAKHISRTDLLSHITFCDNDLGAAGRRDFSLGVNMGSDSIP